VAVGPEQRSRLRQAQLRGLIRGRWPDAEPQLGAFPDGATALADGVGWALAGDTTERSLGGALVWAAAQGCRELHVLVDAHTGLLTRMAARFDLPTTVWQVEGTDLDGVAPDPAPDRLDLLAGPPDDGLDDADEVTALRAAGLDVVVEDGIVRFEVLGLEVGRFVEGPDGEPPRLESGIGRFDREMSALLHADVAPVDAVVAAADLVRRHRHPGAPPHPLRDLGRERWIRHVVLADPGLVGATRLEPVGTTLPRPNVRDPWPAMAWGAGPGGGVAVVCTVGVDLAAVPLAADTRAVLGADATLVVVSVEDLPAPVRAVADLVAGETRLVVVDPPWVATAAR
jgi:hypothetical protein